LIIVDKVECGEAVERLVALPKYGDYDNGCEPKTYICAGSSRSCPPLKRKVEY